MGDSDLERLRRDTNQRASVARTLDGVTAPGCLGRTVQRGRVQEVIRAVEAPLGDEATATELDLRLNDWASAELKSVAADFYHALILFFKGKALKNVLTNHEGEGFEAW